MCAIIHGGEHEEFSLLIELGVTETKSIGGVMFTTPAVACREQQERGGGGEGEGSGEGGRRGGRMEGEEEEGGERRRG